MRPIELRIRVAVPILIRVNILLENGFLGIKLMSANWFVARETQTGWAGSLVLP